MSDRPGEDRSSMFGPLRGRSGQMACALSLVRAARHHGGGGVLLVSGPPGIGKTALVTEVRRQSVALNLRVVGGKCDAIEQVSPGAPVIALLRSGRHPLLDAADFEQIAAVTTEPLLLAERIASHLEQAVTDAPLLITLDDVQWADRVTRFLLRTLVSRLVGLPVVWVFAGRELGLDDDLLCGDPVRVERVVLRPLGTVDLIAIAHDRLGQMPDARVCRYLDAVGGNPLLATYLIDNLARAAERAEPDSVPLEFTASIAHRLAALPPATRELVSLVAVAGRELPAHEAAALLSTKTEGELDGREHAAAHAVESGLLTTSTTTTATDLALNFRHDLVREAVSATIGPNREREIHRRLADHYLTAGDAFLAASHARAACTPGDAAAAMILICAAESLTDLSANDAGELAALAFHTVRVTQPEWLALSRRCLAVLCRTERATDSIAVADAIRAQADEPELVGEVETRVASALWLSGRTNELRARVDRTLRSNAISPAVAARLRAARALAGTRTMPGDVAVKETEAALDEARASEDGEAVQLALQAAAVAADSDARHVKALEYYRELRALGSMDHLAQEVTQLQFLDRYDHAEALLRQLNSGPQQNTTTVLPAVHSAQMWMDYHLGRLEEANAKARALVELGLQLGTQLHTLDGFIVQVAVALLRGDLPHAAALLDRADGVIDADDGARRPGLGLLHGWLRAVRGDVHSAVGAFRPILDGAGESCAYWPLWPCWMGLFFTVGTTAADDETAESAVEAARLAAARNPGVASFEGIALNLRGRHTNDMAMIEHSAAVLATSPRAVLRAGGAESWGCALLDAGHRAEGLAQLDRAWDEYDWMGADHCRALVQRIMREAGARRAKWSATATAQQTGTHALSQAERRVATLIAAGYTNKSAAAELGVSVNTVGTHLRAVFTKLGIRSRVQLANELNRPAPPP